jgi:hypothetical protein
MQDEFNKRRELKTSKSCIGCCNLIEVNEEHEVGKLSSINVSFYPSVCQSNCIYCPVAKGGNECIDYAKARDSRYPQMIAEMIRYLEENDVLDTNARINLSPGEITIHPHRDFILDICQKYNCTFFSNAFVYNEKIAKSLQNKGNAICVSLDSGTRETFSKVNGFDMFDKVLENLKEYRKYGKVLLKYIILPGINDNVADYEGIISILRELKTDALTIARDCFFAPTHELYPSVALLIMMLKDSHVIFDGINYMLNTKQQELLLKYMDFEIYDERIDAYRSKMGSKRFSDEFLSLWHYNEYVFKQNMKLTALPKTKALCEYFETIHRPRLCLWGAGPNGTEFSKLFGKLNIPILITDINVKTHGKLMPNGSVVKAWEDVRGETDAVIVCGSGYYDDVRNIVGDDIFVFDFQKYLSTDYSPQQFILMNNEH